MFGWLKCLFKGHQWSPTWWRRVSGYTGILNDTPFSYAVKRCDRCGTEQFCEWNYGEPNG